MRKRSNLSALIACAALLPLAPGAARADDLLGTYLGATYGRGQIDVAAPLSGHFNERHSTYTLLLGWRPIPTVAAELEYANFGRASAPSTFPNSNVMLSTAASLKALGAFGLLYLPTPVVDFYLKAGLAHVKSSAETTILGCPMGGICPPVTQPPADNRGDFGFAGGGGLMYRIRSFQLRAQYQRFSAAGGNPYLLTFGATWTFW